MDDRWSHLTALWQGWLTEAAVQGDAEEVRRRLAQVPEPMRAQVREHARTVWRICERGSSNGSQAQPQEPLPAHEPSCG